MPQNFVFIDYENLQPKTIPLFEQHDLQVYIFHGKRQPIAPSLERSLEALGDRAKRVFVESIGPNALDFCMAYHIGVLVGTVRQPVIHIVSRDKGYDPLVFHLCRRGVQAVRVGSMQFLPVLSMIKAMTQAERTDYVMRLLFQKALPSTPERLRQTIMTHCQHSVTDAQVDEIVAIMVSRGAVRFEGDAIQYRRPNGKYVLLTSLPHG